MKRTNVEGTLYLLHFEPPYRHARHYLGWTEGKDVERRLEEHRSGQGANLCRVAVEAGSHLVLARTWPGKTRKHERSMKSGSHKRKCPICRGLA